MPDCDAVHGIFCQIQVIQVLLASFNAPIAQLEERQFPKLEATGSIPVGCATHFVTASRWLMFKKTCIFVAALAAVVVGLHWHSKAENPSSHAVHAPTRRPVNTAPTSPPELSRQTVEQLGFKILSWQEDKDGLSVSLQAPNAPAHAELYVQGMALNPVACADEVDLGDSRIEPINAHIMVYHQQDPQSKVSPSVMVHNGVQVCWLIEGNSGLSAEQDLASKLRLAKSLPL